MGRNLGDFHDSILYHGSPYHFKMGDTVLPRKAVTPDDEGPYNNRAFATDSPLIASTYTGDTGKVYRVEPVEPKEVKKSRPFYNVGEDQHTAHYYTSEKGFKVLGEHSG